MSYTDRTALVPTQSGRENGRAVMADDLRWQAEQMARSGMFADAKDAAQALVKIQYGRELGFGAGASMSGVIIVKGRVTLNANLMAARIQATGKYRFRVLKLTNTECEIRFDEWDGREERWDVLGVSTFTQEDAKQAGIQLTNANYKKYPRNMLYARAMSNGAKWFCPSAFNGNTPYLTEELADDAVMQEDGSYVLTAPERAAPIDVEVVVPPASPEEVAALRQLVKDADSDEARVAGYFKVGSLDEMTSDMVDSATRKLNAKLALIQSQPQTITDDTDEGVATDADPEKEENA